MNMNMKSLRDPNRKPTHPGKLLREDILPALKMSQTAFAEHLGVGRVTVSEVLLEKRAVSIDMAFLLAKMLRSTPDFWLRMQLAYDLWEARQRNAAKVAAVQALPRAVISGGQEAAS